jgi:hypothetical protein
MGEVVRRAVRDLAGLLVLFVAAGGCSTARQPEGVAAADPAPVVTEDASAGAEEAQQGLPVRVSVLSGMVWSVDDEVFWDAWCTRSIPPVCGRGLRVVGLSVEDLADIAGVEALSAEDDGALITWLDGPVRLVADYDRTAGTLTLLAPLEPVTLEESVESFERQQFLGEHRPDPPCEPTGSWDGPAPDDLDRPDIQGWLDAVDRYTTGTDSYVQRWFADERVLVVEFTDAGEHLDRLVELYPAPLCVEQVDYSADALNAAHDAISQGREQLQDDGVLLLSSLTSHRGIDVTVFLADAHSRAAIQTLVDPDITEHVHVVGVAQPEPGG